MFNRQRIELKIETLRYHRNLFDLLIRRHHIWLDRASDSEIINLHLELNQLLQQVMQKYAHLIELECSAETP